MMVVSNQNKTCASAMFGAWSTEQEIPGSIPGRIEMIR
jgi:hypothetical protein